MNAALKVRNVSKAFPSNGAVMVALDGVSFDVADGEFLAILGPSGCGKSTLLQIIAGLQEASSGSVILRGKDVTTPPEGLIYLFQQYSKSLLPWRSVWRNVAFPLEREGMTKAALRAICTEQLKLVGLEGFENHYPSQLSGGMQQRVAIARALVVKPKVLLLDEPFSAVDALTRIELQSLVLDICASQGLTTILVTHDVDEAVYMADRIIILSKRPTRVSEEHFTGLQRHRDPVNTRETTRFIALRRLLLDRLLERHESIRKASGE